MNETEPGRLLTGRYRLLSVIGHGGMGVVWRGRDELLNRDVAVKEILWPHLTDEEQQIASRRAVREAQMAGRLSHHNVVRIYDIVEEGGHPSIVMELLPYRSLRDVIREDGPLPPAQAAHVGLGVLAALRAAHAEGILHRDVKPANILLGPDGRVVLTDFGIARATDSPTLTSSGTVLGSPSYLAPERARGQKMSGAAGVPGDLWGLGASLYTAVEGHPPFERGSALATLTAVVADTLEQPVLAGPLASVIEGLLRKDPGSRLGTDETERLLRQAAAEPEEPASQPPAAEKLPAEKLPAEKPLAEELPADARAADSPAAAELVTAGAPATEAAAAPAPQHETAARSPATATDELPATPAKAAGPESPGRPGRGGLAAITGSFRTPGPRRARTARGPQSPRPRRLAAVIAVLAVIAAGVTALAFVLTSSPGQPAAGPAGSTHSAAAHSATATGSPKASSTPTAPSSAARSSSAPGTASASASAGGTSANAAGGALPAGFYRFTNSTGFSIGVPNGWQVSHQGHYVYVTDPADPNVYLLIDQSDQPKTDPLADWKQQQANREGTYPGYHLIRLESVNYPQAEKAADWEFTYNRNGMPVHILNRNILANASHAYALYWSTPESAWSADYHYFQAFASTFRPAPATG